MNKKESPTNEDILQGMPSFEVYEEPEERAYEDFAYSEEDYAIEAYETYLTKQQDAVSVYETGTSWGDFMDDQDSFVANKMREEYADRYEVYKTKSGFAGSHIGGKVKGGVLRKETSAKESPWSCSQCACVQKKGFSCINCGYALKPLTKSVLRKQAAGAEQAKKFLETKVPVEITSKIMDSVISDTVIKRIAMQVAELLKRGGEGVQGIDLRDDLKNDQARKASARIYPDLPTNNEVLMQKALVEEMRRVKPSAPFKVSESNTLNTQHSELRGDYDEGFTLVKTPVVKVKPTKETMQMPEVKCEDKALTKSAKRRLRMKRKVVSKETKDSDINESAVHLNSKAPAQSGVTITNGTKKQSPSQSNLKKSELQRSDLLVEKPKQSQPNGSKFVKSTQSTQSTHGRPEVQKQKREASNSNVTSTLQSL